MCLSRWQAGRKVIGGNLTNMMEEVTTAVGISGGNVISKTIL